eukprot:1158447-Pelagomonas_calceolata.AAC.5
MGGLILESHDLLGTIPRVRSSGLQARQEVLQADFKKSSSNIRGAVTTIVALPCAARGSWLRARQMGLQEEQG